MPKVQWRFKMIAYSKSLNLYPIFTGIGLILALSIGFALFKGPSQSSRACFFIGNGAYYAIRNGKLFNPPTYDSFENAKDFVQNFSPDTIFTDFTRALHEKEQNIFVTYKTWNSFIHIIKRIKTIFAEFGITNPLEQVFIDANAKLPKDSANQIEKDFILPNCNLSDCYKDDALAQEYPMLFYGPTSDKLTNIPANQKLDKFKKQSGLLHKNFSRFFYFLILFNPSEWRMYDTNTGFYYLTPRSTNTPSIRVTTFKQIDPKTAYETEQEITCKIDEENWAFHLDKLFESNRQNWQVYLIGHGSKPISLNNELVEEKIADNIQSLAFMGGIPAIKFKPFLDFLDKKLNTEKLFVSSCHAPAERILRLANKTLSYTLISPISSYDPVTNYVPLGFISSYIPAWLTTEQKTKIEYTLKPSQSDEVTPLNVPKYESLLSCNDNKSLRTYVDTFVLKREQDGPSFVQPNTLKVECLLA